MEGAHVVDSWWIRLPPYLLGKKNHETVGLAFLRNKTWPRYAVADVQRFLVGCGVCPE